MIVSDIRVVIADDHTIVREGLKQLLMSDATLRVVGEARDGHEVMQCVRSLDFDVLARALLLLVVLCDPALRPLRTGRYPSTALSARKLAGMTIGPSA